MRLLALAVILLFRCCVMRNQNDIPNFIHESNSFAGKSNILLGKKATKIFVASDGMEKFFPANKIMIVGNPVRSNIVNNKVSREEGNKFFGFRSCKKNNILNWGKSWRERN